MDNNSLQLVLDEDVKARVHNTEYDITIMCDSEEEQRNLCNQLEQMAKRPKREEIEKKIKEIETELSDLSKRQQDTSKEFNQGIQYAIGYAVGSIEKIFKPILEPEEKNGEIE